MKTTFPPATSYTTSIVASVYAPMTADKTSPLSNSKAEKARQAGHGEARDRLVDQEALAAAELEPDKWPAG